MWFAKTFAIIIALALLYMTITQQTIPMGSPGHYQVFSLWHQPVKFIGSFIAFAFFEWFLIKVIVKMKEGERAEKKKS